MAETQSTEAWVGGGEELAYKTDETRVVSSTAGSKRSQVTSNVFLQRLTRLRAMSTSPSEPTALRACILPSQGPHGEDAPFFPFQPKNVSGFSFIVRIGSGVCLPGAGATSRGWTKSGETQTLEKSRGAVPRSRGTGDGKAGGRRVTWPKPQNTTLNNSQKGSYGKKNHKT